jgi:ligand-binding sensor domain-containing protein
MCECNMRPFFLILLFVFVTGAVRSDSYNLIVKDYSFDSGLPHNSVYASLKDKQGMMWFATWYGLSSFDGVKFRKYNTRNDFNADIPPHKLQNLVEANDNSLWVKTIDHKLFLFDKRTESYYDVFNEIRKKYNVGPKIIKIQKTAEGDLLLLTRNRDLLLAKAFENGRMEVTLLYDSQMRSELRNAAGNLWVESQEYLNWIGTDYSIFSRRKGKMLQSKPADFITTKLGNGPATDFSAAHVHGSNIWLGDRSGNLAIVNYETGNVRKMPLFPGKTIQHIVRLNDQTLMVSVTDGVYEIDANWNIVRKVFDVSPGERTTQSLIDSYDKLWFLIGQKALVYYDPVNNSSRRFPISEGKVIPEVRMADGFELGMFVLTTAGDVLWFDRQGVNKTVLNSIKELQPDGVPNSFFNLQLDVDKILWLSSTDRGVFRLSFPKRQFNLLRIPENQLPTDESPVKTLFQSKDGDIWVATRKPEMYRLNRSGQIKQVFLANTEFLSRKCVSCHGRPFGQYVVLDQRQWPGKSCTRCRQSDGVPVQPLYVRREKSVFHQRK